MSWRPHSHAYANPSAPSAWAQCDRCNQTYLHKSLTFQRQWAGPHLQNLFLLVCQRCLDTPQPQLKPRILPPDPVPIMNARPFNYVAADIDQRYTEDEGYRIDEDGEDRVVENVANNREPG